MSRLVPQSGELPFGRPTSTSREFWDGCSRGKLLFQRCTSCGNAQFPPAPACRACLEPGLKWEQSTGRGSLYSWTVVWRPQSDLFQVPYAPAIIDVAEGYQFLSNVVNCDVDDLHLGMAVEVTFTPLAGGVTIPYFQPARDEIAGAGS